MDNLFYRNPRVTVLAVLFIIVTGALALSNLARQEDPTLTKRFGNVSTFMPGASASRVESLISEPLEAKLREIPEIETLGSRSRAGYSLVDVELADSVGPDEVEVIWAEVRDKLEEARPDLPQAIQGPNLEVRVPVASTLMVALSARDKSETQMPVLTRLAEELELDLKNLPGTEETEVHGEVEEEILVATDPYRLAARGITDADVAAVISASDTRRASGRLRGTGVDMLVEVEAELDSVERVSRIVVGAEPNGGVLRVADVAEVGKRRVEPEETLALVAGVRSVVVTAVMEPDRNVGIWSANARDVVEAFRANYGSAVDIEIIYEQNDYTSERLGSLALNLATALVIVLLALFWFMGARSAVTVGVALPLSAGMVLAALYVLDIPLHQMSVTGLIISLGLLIDNAIVVVEAFKLARRRGEDIAEAIGASVRHLAVPLGASTATTVLAFAPIAMTPGATGEFTGTIAISVILAIVSSFVLAMTVVPAIAGFIEARFPSKRDGGGWWVNGYSNAGLRARYAQSLRAAVRKPGLGLAVGCVLPIIGFALAPTLQQQFFPPVDRDQFQIQVALSPQSSLEQTERIVRSVDVLLGEYETIESSIWFIGEGGPRTYYNVLVNADGVASFAGAVVNTTSAEATAELLPVLQERLIRSFPEAEILALPFEQGPPVDAPIELRVVGPELDTLRRLATELRSVLADVPSVTYTRDTLGSAEPRLAIHPRENLTSVTGLATGDLPRTLDAALHGIVAGSVQEGAKTLPIRVRGDADTRSAVSAIATMPIARAGEVLSLDQIAEVRLEPAAAKIDRYQGERINTVQGFLLPFVLPAAALQEFEARLAESGIEIPAGYRLELGGEQERRSESVGNLISTFITFLMVMVGVVVLSLNSFRHALIIGLTGFLSVGLALFGVRLFGYPMGFTALIGTLGLIGLAINGAIIVLSALKAREHRSVEEVVDTVVDATRHILSTTVTTIGGFMPLIVFGGTFWPPLATAIAGGVAGSAIIALYTVPAIYWFFERRRVRETELSEVAPEALAEVMPTPLRSVG